MHDIDPELKYCPQCDDEYRAEMKLCASCEVELIDGPQLIAKLAAQEKRPRRSPDISRNDQLVALRKGNLLDMKNLQHLLKQEGIPALIAGEGPECKQGCCGPEVILHVRMEDAEDSVVVLAGEFQRSTALASHDLSTADSVFDQDAEKVTCPACGYRFAPTSPECPDCGLTLG